MSSPDAPRPDALRPDAPPLEVPAPTAPARAYVLGAGGHARVVIATLEVAGTAVVGLFDDDPARAGTMLDGVPVLGRLADHLPLDAPLVLAIGRNDTRARLAAALDGQVAWASAVHPRALVHPSVEVGPGTVVFAGAIVQPGTRLGAHVIVNTAATIDHDGQIGDAAHVAPGCHLAGNVTLGEGAFLGVGCAVVPGVTVGAWTTVGAGGVVVGDLPEKVVAVGVPARVRG